MSCKKVIVFLLQSKTDIFKTSKLIKRKQTDKNKTNKTASFYTSNQSCEVNSPAAVSMLN